MFTPVFHAILPDARNLAINKIGGWLIMGVPLTCVYAFHVGFITGKDSLAGIERGKPHRTGGGA